MSEEIQFFGLGVRNSPHNQISLDGLKKYGISYPKTSSFTISELNSVDQDSFPWPLAVRIPAAGNGFSTPKLVSSWSQLQDLIDGIRNPDDTVLFSLPPQAAKEDYIQNVFAYIGKGFVCLHNVSSGITYSLNTDNFLSDLGLSDDWVIRIVRGNYGWFFDSCFHRDDPKLVPIFYTVDSYQKKFQEGYRAALNFATQNILENTFPHNFGLKTSVGDAYSSGYYLGSLFVKRLTNITKTAPTDGKVNLDKSTLILSKITCSEADYSGVINVVSCHNQIAEGKLDSFSLKIACNPAQCKEVGCGEGDNYCSSFCKSIAEENTIPKQLCQKLDATCRFLDEVHKSKASEHPNIFPIEMPADIESACISIDWTSSISQYRVTAVGTSGVSIRFQATNVELLQKVTCGEESYNIVSWKHMGNEEFDLELKMKHFDFTQGQFSNWLETINRENLFVNKSTYAGSGQKYAALSCSSKGFHLEDGTLVIPMSRFLRHLEKYKNIKIGIQ
jgi:hypothetical protein